MSAQKQRCVACGQPIPSGGQCCSGACANFVAGVFDASDLGRPCMKDKDAREDLEIAKSEFITFDEYFGPNPKKKMSAKKIEALKKMDGEMKGRIRVLLGDAEFDLDGEIKKYCVELAANTLVECKSNLLARQAVGEILSAQANLLLKGIGPKRVGGTDLNLENKTVECMLWTGESRKKSDLVDVIVFISPSDESPGEQKKSEAIPKAKAGQNPALYVLRRMFHNCLLAPYQTVKDNPVVLRASYVLGYSPATTFRRAMTGKINPDDLACMLVECGVARPESKKKCEDRYRRELKTPILHKVNLSTVPKAKVLRRGGGPPGSEIPNPRLYAPSRTILALHNQAFVDAVSGEPEAFVLCKHLETAEVLYKKRILEQVKTKTKWIDTVKLALEKSSADETIREDIRKKIAGKSVFWTSEGDKNKPERHLKTYLECYDRCDIEVWELGGLPDTFIKINYGDVAERAWQRLCARIGIPMRDSYSLVCILAIAYGEQWPIVLREDANTFYAFPKAKKDKYKLSHVAHVTVPSEGQPKCECGKTLAAPPPVAPPREAAKVESKKEEEQKPETKKIPHTPPAQPPPPPPPEPKPTVASVPVPPKPAESKIPSKPAEPAGPLPVVAPEPTPAAVPTPVAVVPAAVLVPPPPPIPPRDAPREQPPSAIPSRSTSPITASDLTKGGTILKHVEPSQGKVAKPEPPGGQRSMASALADAMAARRPSLAESAEDVEDEPQDFGDDAKCVARQFPGNVGTFTEFMACI